MHEAAFDSIYYQKNVRSCAVKVVECLNNATEHFSLTLKNIQKCVNIEDKK